MNWPATKAFFQIILVTFGVFAVFSLSEDYDHAIFIACLFLTFYGLNVSVEEFVSKSKKFSPTSNRIMNSLTSLVVILLMANIMNAGINMVTQLNYCSGWAYSAEYCAIQKVHEKYRIEEYEAF